MRATVILAASIFALAACGGSSQISSTKGKAAHPKARSAPLTPGQRRMVRIVREWSRLLDAGENGAIARLFKLPAVFVQGQFTSQLYTRADVAIWHSQLACSSQVVSITYKWRFATAVFRLGNRGKIACSAPGTLVATRFEFIGGKIASWVQVPVPPGQRPRSLPA